MGISPEMKRRWRSGMVGNVPIASPRGIIAVVLVALCLLVAFSGPIVETIVLVRGEERQDPEINHDTLVVNLAFNIVLLMLIPFAAIAISRPGEAGAVVRRLRLQVRPVTAVHALIGAGATIGALVLFGVILTGLSEAGLYEAEQSPLVPQIQELLNWPTVIGLSVIAAMTEEVFFRGVLQPRIGMVASSALFGVIHLGYGTVLQVVAPFVLGLLFAVLYERTRSLWAPIAAHFTFDFVQLAVLLLEKEGHIQAVA